jgi:hypothetical protein
VNRENLDRYSDMWTRDVAKYALVEFEVEGPVKCLVMDLEARATMILDDDEDVVAALIENLRQAGARVFSPAEARAYRHAPSPSEP